MKTPITYYGGKQSMTDTIKPMIPPHKIYCEPLFGGGALFFSKSKSGIEVINDNNEKLITFYMEAQNNFEQLEKMIKQTLHSESMHKRAKDIYNNRIEHNQLELAWSVWLVTNNSFAGNIHGGWKWCNGTSGSHSAIILRNKREQFNTLLYERLRDVQICCRDYIKVIEDRDTKETFFYLDPPYPGSYQGHYKGYTMKHFAILCEVLSNLKGKFILSCFWSQTLKYYCIKNGWKIKRIKKPCKVTHLGARSKIPKAIKNKEEILIWNYEIGNTLF